MPFGLHVTISPPGEAPKEFDASFDKPRVIIGRDESCDLVLPLKVVSRQHAAISQENSEWILEDLKSSHGTLCNGQNIGSGGKKLLRHGDVVEIVHAKLVFRNEMLEPLGNVPEEQTSVVARKLVSAALTGLQTGVEVPYLLFLNGPNEGQKIELAHEMTEVVLGRGAEADVQVADPNISRRHCIVRRNFDEVSIEDLQSKNGVMVNGNKIATKTILTDAADIYLGAIHLTFVDKTQSVIGRLSEIPMFAETGRQPPKTPTPEPFVDTAEKPLAPKTAIETAAVGVAPAEQPTKRPSYSTADLVLILLAATVGIGLLVGVFLLTL